jgi:hypothetical protein
VIIVTRYSTFFASSALGDEAVRTPPSLILFLPFQRRAQQAGFQGWLPGRLAGDRACWAAVRFVFTPPAEQAAGLLTLPWTEPLEEWKDVLPQVPAPLAGGTIPGDDEWQTP